MEARLKKIEDEMSEMQKILLNVVTDLAELKGKISNLPTTFQLATFTVGSVIAVSGLVFAIARAVN